MTHFREHFDSPYIGHWTLEGRDVVVTILSVKPGTVEGEKGRKDKKAIAKLKEFEKPFVVNVTNAKTIAGMYGAHVEGWIGKQITLYESTTKTKEGADTPCLRVRPMIPKTSPAPTRPKGPIASATNADELLAAIASQAARIADEHVKAWPVVLERCRELGVSEDKALEVLAKNTPSSSAAGGT